MTFTPDQLAIFAVRTGNLPLLKERVEAGGSVNYFDQEHGSALIEAIRRNNIEILEWLISNGVDANVEMDPFSGPRSG